VDIAKYCRLSSANRRILDVMSLPISSNPYLGAELTNTMSWDKQVQKVVAKGNKALGFIRRNVGSCPAEVKKQAYLALVRPHLGLMM
jgi:hypothetical protein